MNLHERVIALDTETTGVSHRNGDRIVEIGAVELVGNIETGKTFHAYINPYPREVHPEAVAVHGLTTEFLMDKPKFRGVVDGFLDFIGDSPLVIHNAPFDMGFINAELEKIARPALANEVRDTLAETRRKFPGSRATLDALCSRFGIDNSGRDLHGALIDANLLAQVYVKLKGLDRLALGSDEIRVVSQRPEASATARTRPARPFRDPVFPTAAESAAHAAFLASDVKDSIWGNA